MGCDIHTIVQIRKNQKWEYVPELPQQFNERDYSTFSFLANVRNNFNTKGFKPKGLPKDLGVMKFGWESCVERAKERYETDSTEKVKMPNGEYLETYDKCFKRFTTKEEYDSWKGSKGCNGSEYYVYDCAFIGGELVNVPYKELFKTLDDFLKDHYEDEYDEELNDYGDWAVDFSCVDYHSHSYLSLKELQDSDLEDYKSVKCQVVKELMDKFFELGGVLPQGMTIENRRSEDLSFAEMLREAIEPIVIIKWKRDKIEKCPVYDGIKELEEIAKQYGVESEDIRIVFAFDN